MLEDKAAAAAGIPAGGPRITERFQPIHQLMNGAPAPIDGSLDLVRKIRDRLQLVGSQAGGQSPVSALTDQVLLDLNRALLVASESLPPPVNELVAQIAQLARATVSIEAKQQSSTGNIFRRSSPPAGPGWRDATHSRTRPRRCR